MFAIATIFCILLCFFNVTFNRKLEEMISNLLPSRDVCGKQTVESQRIYGGKETSIGEFPWLVLLKSDVEFTCGGALINSRYVLTAAHCVHEEHNIKCSSGRKQFKTDTDWEGEENPGLDYCSDQPIDVEIKKIITHEGYLSVDKEGIYDDIVLIRLKKEVNYTDFIIPICLPVSSELRNKAFSGKHAVLAGWGSTKTRLHFLPPKKY